MGALLFAWLAGLFGIVGIVCWYLLMFIKSDSHAYDEQYVWLRKVKQ
ncbi:hypothetical protein [Paenibacillus aquistagni]|nr:hypothetical protein [Paenibacillus aquistagni]